MRKPWLPVLGVLILLTNLGLLWLGSQTTAEPLLAPYDGQSDQVMLIAPLDTDRVLAGTNSNRVVLFERGRAISSVQINALIGGLASTSDGTIYVGTSLGEVIVLDSTLQQLRSFKVTGRIVAIHVDALDTILVGHGIGAYSERYYVSSFKLGADTPTATTQTDFTLTDVTSNANGTVFFATLNSRIGAIDQTSGKRTWSIGLPHPPTVLLAIPQRQQLAVGDDKGTLTLLDSQGAIVWQTTLGPYPIRSLVLTANQTTLLAGDSHGAVSLVDTTGAILLSERVTTSDIGGLFPQADGRVVVIPRDGTWVSLNPNAVKSIDRSDAIRTALVIFNCITLPVLLLVTVLSYPIPRSMLHRSLSTLWQARIGYLFIAPALGLIILFSYYPAAMAIYYSLTNFSLSQAVTEFIGAQNYVAIATSDFYFQAGLTNMIILIIASAIQTLSMPLLVAELVFWLPNQRHRYLFRTLFVLPAVVPGLVTTLLWRNIYEPNGGLLNNILQSIGLPQLQRAWLGDEQTALWAIIGVGFPFVGTFAFLIYLGGLMNINPEFYDAVMIDGAGWWSRFWAIDVPLLVPQLRIMLFFAVSGTIGGFASIFILTQGGPGYATYIPALQMYLRIAAGDFGYASAIGVVLFAMIFVITAFILRVRRSEAM